MIGDYNKTVWQNGGTPAINATNLNNIEDKIKELDSGVATREALANFISDFFTSGVADLTDPSRDFSISYNNNMRVYISTGVAYSNGKRISYEPGYPNPGIEFEPVSSGAVWIFINAVENHAGGINPDLVPVGFEGIKAFRTTNTSNPLNQAVCVPLYRIRIDAFTEYIPDASVEILDLRTQMIINNVINP